MLSNQTFPPKKLSDRAQTVAGRPALPSAPDDVSFLRLPDVKLVTGLSKSPNAATGLMRRHDTYCGNLASRRQYWLQAYFHETSVFDAVDKQLGLKLEKTKRSYPVLVIEDGPFTQTTPCCRSSRRMDGGVSNVPVGARSRLFFRFHPATQNHNRRHLVDHLLAVAPVVPRFIKNLVGRYRTQPLIPKLDRQS